MVSSKTIGELTDRIKQSEDSNKFNTLETISFALKPKTTKINEEPTHKINIPENEREEAVDLLVYLKKKKLPTVCKLGFTTKESNLGLVC